MNHINEIYIFNLKNNHQPKVVFANQPVGVAIDEKEMIYAMEYRTGIIQVFHGDGRKSHTMSTAGKGYCLHKIQFNKRVVTL